MKKFGISFAIIGIIILTALIFPINSQNNEQYLRIHIRANSNEQIDQSVKYKVKERVVDYLTPLISTCTSKEKAMEVVKAELTNVEKVSKKVLTESGFSYGANAKVTKEEFPTRVYENVTLEKGEYEALIVNLGSGQGDNWWCVIYPPLCFADENTPYVYKSKILEIINDFFN